MLEDGEWLSLSFLLEVGGVRKHQIGDADVAGWFDRQDGWNQ
jgi:hypothetical protein